MFPPSPRQLAFDTSDRAPMDSAHLKVTYRHLEARSVTFKAGLRQPIHRWFRLTPSFGPDLVEDILLRLGCSASSKILDPFSGAGTTLTHCQLNGLEAYGYEINPFLHSVCATSLFWQLDLTELRSRASEIQDRYNELLLISPANVSDIGILTPAIHNPLRWWRPDVLRELLILKHSISTVNAPDSAEWRFFRLALASALVPDLTNVTLGKLQLHFIDRSRERIDVIGTFLGKVGIMLEDLQLVQAAHLSTTATVFQWDATLPNENLAERQIDYVVTSPPYPNRYSYVWNTRPHLYFFDFMSIAGDASQLDLRSIGGTWGTATSVLARGVVEPESAVIGENIRKTVADIREHDGVMANYVLKYFNMLARHIAAMEPSLAENAQVAYVVGCSRIKGVFVETDVLLAEIFKNAGYDITSIERIRKRNSGKDLHEAIVFAKRNCAG